METKELEGVAHGVTEHSRVYVFPGGDRVVLKDVTQITVRGSGTHRVQTKDGLFHIIACGWIHIELDLPKGWSF